MVDKKTRKLALTPQSYLASGAVGLLWFFVWQLSIHVTPADHPTISEYEKVHIEKSIADNTPPTVSY